jgi:hypothetical protein
MLHGAVKDGQLPTRTRDGTPVPASAWQASSERAEIRAGRLNFGLPPVEAAYSRPGSSTQGPRWTVALVWLGDLRRWHKSSIEPRTAEAKEPTKQDVDQRPAPTSEPRVPKLESTRGFLQSDIPLAKEMHELIASGSAR